MPMKNTLLKIKAWPEIALIYTSIVWGSSFFIVKDAVTSMHPVALITYRFTFAALPLGFLLIYLKKPLWKDLKQGIWLGLLVWISILTQTLGLQYTSATNSGFITGLFVVIVPFLYFFTRKRAPTFLQQLAILLSIIGLWLLTGGIRELNRGDLLTLLCAFVCAMHILAADRSSKICDPLVLCFQQFVVIGAASLATAFALQLPLSVEHTHAWWSLLFLILFPTLSAFLIQLFVQRELPPVKVSIILSSEPLFAAFFAWAWGGEELTLVKMVGGSVLFAAMWIADMPPPAESATEAV